MLPAQETNTHLTSLLFSFFEHIHSADLHLPKVTRAWLLKRIKAHSMTALEGHIAVISNHTNHMGQLHDDDLATTRQTVRCHHQKTCFYLPVRRHDFGSLVESRGCVLLANAMIHEFRVAVLLFLFLRHDMIRPGRDFKLKDISIVMSLSLHCQSCQKYRRRVVVTLPPHWQPLWQLWRPLWRQCGGNVAAMWRQCGGHVAAMWRRCGGDVAAMWRRCGGHVVAMRRRCGGHAAAM